MATTLTQILDRLDAILKTNVPAGATVERDRNAAVSRAEAPLVNVRARNDETESYSGEMDRHLAIVDLEFYVRDDVGVPAVELLHAALHTAIVTDAALLSICLSVRLMPATFTPAEADGDSLLKTAPYRFTYLIPQTTL